MDELKIPVILVIGNYLGTISHSLTTIKVLEANNAKIDSIILNCRKSDTINSEETINTIKSFAPNLPIYSQ